MNGYGVPDDRRFIQGPAFYEPELEQWQEITEPVTGPAYKPATPAGYGAAPLPGPQLTQPPAPPSISPPRLQIAGDEWEEIPRMQEAPTLAGRVKQRWQLGELSVELGYLQTRKMFGETDPEIDRRIEQIRLMMPAEEWENRGIAERIATETAQMAPTMTAGVQAGMERGVILGTGFAGIAAIAGQAGPQALTPEEVVTVPGAAAAGYAVGMTSGMLESIGRIEAGLAYDELITYKDPKTGEELHPEVAKWAAMGVGVVNAALELFQIKMLVKTIPGGKKLLHAATNGAMKKLLTGTPLKRLAMRSTGAVKYLAGETSQEIAQEASNIVAQAFVTEITNQIEGTKIAHQTKRQIFDRLKDVAESSLYAFTGMGMPGAAIAVGGELRRGPQPPPPQDPGTQRRDILGKEDVPEYRRIVTKIKDDAASGALSGEDAERVARMFRQHYPERHKEIDDLQRIVAKLNQVETPGVEEGLVPVGVTGELARKSAEESADVFERELERSEQELQSVIQGQQLQAALTEEEAIRTAAAAEEEAQPIPYEEEDLWEEEEAPTPTAAIIDQAAAEAEQPKSQAQAEAGTYKKGHVKLQGLNISIETPRDAMRHGISGGKAWSNKMTHHYGQILGYEGKDKDAVDVFIGRDPEQEKVYVVDQTNVGAFGPTGFDEHKVMMGFPTVEQARMGYMSNYEKGWQGLRNITPMSMDAFKYWLEKGDKKIPVSEWVEKRREAKAPEVAEVWEEEEPRRALEQRLEDQRKAVAEMEEPIEPELPPREPALPPALEEKPPEVAIPIPGLKKARKQRFLIPWIADMGGLRTDEPSFRGELKDLTTQLKKTGKTRAKGFPPHFFNNQSPWTMDTLVDEAINEGFLPEGATDADLLAAIEKDSRAVQTGDEFQRHVRMEEAGSQEYLDKLADQYYKETEAYDETDQDEIEQAEKDVREDVKTSLELEEEADPAVLESLSDWFEEVSQPEFTLKPTEPTPAEKIAIAKAKGEIVSPEKEKKPAVFPTEKIKPATKGEQAGLFPKAGEQLRIEEAAEEPELEILGPALPAIAHPNKQTGKASKNIASLLHKLGIAEEAAQDDAYLKVKREGFMDLVIENHLHHTGKQAIYFTHYYEQEHDLIMDGEMVWEITPEGKLILLETAVQNPFTGGESRAKDIKFANVFASNIVEQFKDGKVTRPRDEREIKPPPVETPPAEAAEIEEVVEEVEEEPKAGIKPTGIRELADWVEKQITGRDTGAPPIKAIDLFQKANEAFGGTMAQKAYTVKDAYDALEVGINLFVFRTGMVGDKRYDPRKAAAHASMVTLGLKNRLNAVIPTQSKRTEETDQYQQFSTPPPLAYVANWVANLSVHDTYLEPSAGTGNIAIFAKLADVKNIVLNELSDRRSIFLKQTMGDASYFAEDAAQLNNILPPSVKPTVIVMNPPFSSTAGRLKANKTMYGARHIEQALKRLEPNGRLVAIVGKGMAMDAKTFSPWWSRIQGEYNVRANVEMAGEEYRKFGTTFDNRILVIDKVAPSDYPIVTGRVEKIEDLIPLLTGVRDARVLPTKRKPVEPAGEAVPPRGEVEARPDAQLQLPIGDVGPRPGARKPGQRRPVAGVGGAPIIRTGVGEEGIGGRPGRKPVAPAPSQADIDRARERDSEQPGRPVEGQHPGIRGSAAALEVKIQEAPPSKPTEFTDAIFENYTPQRIRIEGAQPHKYQLVESSAMASVLPPATTYQPTLPGEVITEGRLSDAQAEFVTYAGAAHADMLPNGQRKGIMCGDGTGVGKGREIAGIFWDNWNKGRKKGVWITQNKALLEDAKRDIEDLGWDSNVLVDYGKTKMGDIPKAKQGILFVTYGTLRQKKEQEGKNRLDPIVQWLGPDFDGAIIFDEAHNMGNAISIAGARGRTPPSQTALAGVKLQEDAPNARVAYFSATGATEIKNYTYGTRLGLWGEGTPFPTAQRFVSEIEQGGLASMELIAREMKQMGVYSARSLAYEGIEYDRLTHELTDKQREYYNEFARAWQLVHENIVAALEETDGIHNGKAKGSAMSRFWGEELRFFSQVLTTFQVPSLIKTLQKDMDAGHSPVIQFVNTNAAQQERARARQNEGEEIEDLDVSPKEIILNLVEKSFPTYQYEEVEDDQGNKSWQLVTDSEGNPVHNAEALAMKEETLNKLAGVTEVENPLDQLTLHFGTDVVAEVTGRRERRNYDDKGKMVLEKRTPGKTKADVAAYLADQKKILMFSYAGGTGASYHPDLRFVNQRLRRHYLLQPGWQANKAMQGLGRTHRTNQKQPPEVILCETNLKGHARFISSIARKLDQLGALTRGTRRAASQGLFAERDNLESAYANAAVRRLIEDMHRGTETRMDLQTYMQQAGLDLVDREGALNTDKIPQVHQFLNRILHMEIDQQNLVFDLFAERLDTQVQIAIEAGTLDVGMETLRGDKIEKVSEQTVYTDVKSGATTRFIELDVTLPAPKQPFRYAQQYAITGFFRNKRSGKIWAAGGTRSHTDARTGVVTDQYALSSPTYTTQTVDRAILLGKYPKALKPLAEWAKQFDTKKAFKEGYDSLSSYTDEATYKLLKDYDSPVFEAMSDLGISRYEAEKVWEYIHSPWEKVTEEQAKAEWEKGLAEAPDQVTGRYNLITGILLPVWDRISKGHTRIMRTQTEEGERLIGRLVPQEHLTEVLRNLGAEKSKIRITPKEIHHSVLEDGADYTLANGWRIQRRKVADENRIEITGPDYAEGKQLEARGVFTERINYNMRYFVPTTLEGVETIAHIIERRPVVEQNRRERIVPPRDTHLALSNFLSRGQLTNKSAKELREIAGMVDTIFAKHLPKEAYDRVKLHLTPMVHLDFNAVEQAMRAHGIKRVSPAHIMGAVQFNNMFATVQLSYQYGMERIEEAAHHELFHVASNWLLPPKDHKKLMDYYEGNEERAAEAYADWAMERKPLNYKPPDSPIKQLFVRLRRLFILIKNALTRKGFMRPEDIFGKIYTKQYAYLIPRYSKDARVTAEAEYAPPFYSALVNAIETKLDMPRKVPSLLKWLERNAKPAEIKWYDVHEWIRSNQKDGKINREELLKYLKANRINIEEVEPHGEAALDEFPSFPDEGRVIEPSLEDLDESIEANPFWLDDAREDMRDNYYDEETGEVDQEALEEDALEAARNIAYESYMEFTEAIHEDSVYGYKIYARHADQEATLVDSIDNHLGDFSGRGYFKDAVREAEENAFNIHATAEPETLYEAHTLPGGSKYRELLFSWWPPDLQELPPGYRVDRQAKLLPQQTMEWRFLVKDQNEVVHARGKTAEEAKALCLAKLNAATQYDTAYYSPHWRDDKNVLAHARFNDRVDSDGNRILFLEEIQSDWHQEGKKKGYYDPKTDAVLKHQRVETLSQREAFAFKLRGDYRIGTGILPDTRTLFYNLTIETPEGEYDLVASVSQEGLVTYKASLPEHAKELMREWARLNEHAKVLDKRIRAPKGLVLAPFAQNWHEFVMKRMLRWAAENGYDKIAWTTGAQQADRYNLRKYIDSIEWMKGHPIIRDEYTEKRTEEKTYQITVTTKEGRKLFQDDVFTAERLEETIGKEHAEKIVRAVEGGQDAGEFRGLELEVGGEGMSVFYDQLLPGFMGKYVKQWGGKIGKTGIYTLAETTEPVHSVDINTPMKQAVLVKGQAYFAIDTKELEERYFGKPTEKQEAAEPKKVKAVEDKLDKLPTEEDRPKTPSTFEEAEDDWFGDHDWAKQVSSVEAYRLQVEIAKAVGDKNVLGNVYFSDRCKDVDQAIHIYLDIKRNPGHVSLYWDQLTAEQQRIVTLAGTIEHNPRLKAIADYIAGQYDKIGKKALGWRVIFNTIDNYVGRAWKMKKAGQMSTDDLQKFKITSRHAKHRVFETILEGWATREMELKVTGATNNLELIKNEISRVIEDKRLISQLRKMKWRDTDLPVISHERENDEYKEIQHPNFIYWMPDITVKAAEAVKKYWSPDIRIQENWAVTKKGNTRASRLLDSEEQARAWIERQEDPESYYTESRHYLWRRHKLYAAPEVANKLNKVLGVSKLKGGLEVRGISMIDLITKYNAIMKSIILMTGFFHHQAFLRSYLMGTRHKTAKEWNPIWAYKEGLKAINSLSPEIELLVRNGLTLGRMQDWEENILMQEDTAFGKLLAKTHYTNEFRNWVNDLRERQARFLFQRFGAGLKARAGLIELRNALKDPANEGMEINDIAKMVAGLINDDFGGLHLRRMHRNPTTQHIFRLLALAPDWTESNVNTAWKSFTGGSKQRRHFYRRFWTSVLTKGLMATTVANILLSFADDEDLIDRYVKAWKAGPLKFRWLDIDITPLARLFTDSEPEARRYFSILGHFKDPIKFALNTFSAAMHKSSVFSRALLSFAFAIDWKGHGFTSIDEFMGVDDKGLYLVTSKDYKMGERKGGKLRGKLVTPRRSARWGIKYAQIPSYIMEQTRGMTPIQVQAIMTRMMGEIDSFDMIMRMAGAHASKTWPTPKKLTAEWKDEWIRARRAGESVLPLKKRIDAYNARERRLGQKGEPISWTSVVQKAMNQMKAERAAEQLKARR